MSGLRRRALRLPIVLGIALFLALLAGSPLLHHDLAAHGKASRHCDACVSGSLAPRVEAACTLALPHLDDAGRVECRAETLRTSAEPLRLHGRAPPA